MISFEDELAGLGADPAHLAAERREVFSLFGELRAASYLAVALVTIGVGIWLKNNADRLGPITILGALLLAAVACYAYALPSRRRLDGRNGGVPPPPRRAAAPAGEAAGTPTNEAAAAPAREAAAAPANEAAGTTIVADYVLLLGALLISAAVGYAESQFHLLGPNWSRHLLFLALFHIATAYVADSRLVLSAGLAALAGWFGAEFRTFDSSASFGTRALACAATVTVLRLVNRHKAFDATYEHFAANLAFFGALAWAFDKEMRWIGVLLALGLAALVVWRGLRGGGEAMVIYAIVYATIAFDAGVTALLHDAVLIFLYLICSTPVAIVILFVVYRRLKERRA